MRQSCPTSSKGTIIVPKLLPIVANIFTRDLVSDITGVDVGNAIGSGGHIYMLRNGQAGGNSVASQETLMAYMINYDSYIADSARHERESRSPFDASSQYTFLGNIVNKIGTFANTNRSISSMVSGVSGLVSTSISSLMPGASAVEIANNVTETAKNTAENCPFLDSIGAVGDAFCNPYMITDTTTLDGDPTNIIQKLNDDDQFEDIDQESDTPKIKEDSKLANYIIYCGQRESAFGVADQNIAGNFEKGTGNGYADTLLGAVPIVGDSLDILSNKDKIANMGYITGQACVTGTENDGASSKWPSWSETKYYQRFVEDQRLLENMGVVEKSSVTAFLDDYYEKHPLDNSFEGVIARQSGLTKEQVVATIDQLDYLATVSNYNPVGRLPLQPSDTNQEDIKIESSNTEQYLDSRTFFYEDRRIRNFAA